jgi:hypothetical protein
MAAAALAVWLLAVAGPAIARPRPVEVRSPEPLTPAQTEAMQYHWGGPNDPGYAPTPNYDQNQAEPPAEKRGRRVDDEKKVTTIELPERQGANQPPRRPAPSQLKDEPPAPLPAPLPAPTPPPAVKPTGGPVTEADMAMARQAFDRNYQGSLGKTRKELKELWGFPMQQMGDNGEEVAYGFRQRGLLNVLPAPTPAKASKGKKAGQEDAENKSYYANSPLDPSQPGKHFACLVILWVNEKGRGVVVDGEAVGDCFMVETLPQKPEFFER